MRKVAQMKTIKLLSVLLGVGLLALAADQVAKASSCTGPQVGWDATAECSSSSEGGTDRGYSIGYGDYGTNGRYLCVDSRGSNTSYVDSFGYDPLGTRITGCNPQGSGCCGHDCDTTGCSAGVTHDYFAAWPRVESPGLVKGGRQPSGTLAQQMA
jgi:hypothetical protein